MTRDNFAVLIQGRYLSLIDDKGKELFFKEITKEDESFCAPAAVDAAGRIYVAGSKRLYCFE